MVAHAFNSVRQLKQTDIYMFKANLVYIMRSSPAMAT